jgi:hypothetical protein
MQRELPLLDDSVIGGRSLLRVRSEAANDTEGEKNETDFSHEGG